MTEPRIRIATILDLDELAAMNQKAFINSPPQTFFANLRSPLTIDARDKKPRNNQTQFLKFLIRRSFSLDARITVVIVTDSDSGKDKIVASTIWRPPITPGSKKNPSMLSAIRLGLLGIVANWGLSVMGRISEMVQASESVFDEEYKTRKIAGSPESSWYLQLAGTDPAYQGKGYMSMLLREAFHHAPNSVFTLEATTPRSRDMYQHFGFKVIKEVTVARGKVDSSGLVASGDSTTGFPIYPMIKT
ncbi:hypothetical protein VKT23_017889 [Stygiomarasmius scandens]|uniref:N-acetyltransferase domain-containing protein n=1 Tax=Marasmiellus scandens TaxID=2682957 RepID=A0ABR1IU79_9AGAR